MGSSEHEFHDYDYVVFALSLGMSLGVGVFFAITGSRQANTEDYLMGGKQMNPFAVGLSLFASLVNAVFLIGKRRVSSRHSLTLFFSLVSVESLCVTR